MENDIYLFQNIIQNTLIDTSMFGELKTLIYTYMYSGERVNIKNFIYPVCYYLEDLLNYAQNVEIVTDFLNDYIEYHNLLEKHADYVKKFLNIDDFLSIPLPLERQTNAPPPEEPTNEKIILFKRQLYDCIYLQNNILHTIDYYLDEISVDMNYTQKIILKLDIVRCENQIGEGGDILINDMRIQYLNLNKKLIQLYRIRSGTLHDVTFSCNASQEKSVSKLIYTYHKNLCTIYPYELPTSVIVDCYDKPNLWNILCKKKNIMTGTILPCPKPRS